MRRVGAIASIASLELLVAQAAGRWGAHMALGSLRAHPRGGEALFDEGGRLAIDLALQHLHALMAAGQRVLVLLAVWAVVSVLLGGALARLVGDRAARPLASTARLVLGRTPGLFALAALGLVFNALALLCAAITARWALPAPATAGDAQLALLRAVAVTVCAGAVPALVARVWLDRARARLMLVEGEGLRAALGGARADVLHTRALLRLAALRALFALVSIGVSTLELAAFVWLGPSSALALAPIVAAAHGLRFALRCVFVRQVSVGLGGVHEAKSA